ncbi:MAG: hypothetical protein LQ346_004963, partial [Caloplaca aetnensis]
MSSLFFGDGTNVVLWKANSDTRGTFDILSTCLITLLLCVWTAVHLNISPPGRFWEPKVRKVAWLVLALLAPEVVAYTAWEQRNEAIKIMQVVNEAYGRPNPTPWLHTPKAIRQPTLEAQGSISTDNGHPWTIVHGFYALMGGFAITIPGNLPKSEAFVPAEACGTWFITGFGLKFLLKMDKDQLPPLTEEEIKSKIIQRLPISLLELNTFGHAVCALFIYLLWWEKPFEVDMPTTIKSQALLDGFALAWTITGGVNQPRSPLIESVRKDYEALLNSNRDFQALDQDGANDRPIILQETKWELLHGLLLTESELIAPFDSNCTLKPFHLGGWPAVLHKAAFRNGARTDTSGKPVFIEGIPGKLIPGTAIRIRDTLEGDVVTETGFRPPLPRINLTEQDINRWNMAKRAAESNPASKLEDESRLVDYNLPFRRRCRDGSDLFCIFKIPTATGFSAAAVVYGGLHALAWFAHFGSPTQQLLWRIC